VICIKFNDVLKNPDKYVEDIYKEGFVDIHDGKNIFKNIQPREKDEAYDFVKLIFPDYDVSYNFIRQSCVNQKEPNYIHTDEMMGDKTIILYLNKNHPKKYGTTIYNELNKKSIVNYGEYNSMFIFDSKLKHSRNLIKNFGKKKNCRLIQVLFLKKIL